MPFPGKLTYMLRGADLAWDRMVNPFEPSVAEVEKIQKEIEGTLLAEMFPASFFASVKGQARAYEAQLLTDISNAYSILQPPEQRAKVLEFAVLMKAKMSPSHWKHFSERIRSDSRSQSLLALFEMAIAGNLLSQLPDNCVRLNIPTSGNNDADIGLLLDGRMVHLELTVLDESDQMKARLPMRRKQKVSIWSSDHSEVDGSRLLDRITKKSREFIQGHPNILAIQILNPFDWTELARDRYMKHEFKNVGLILPFGRIELAKDYVKEADASCRLTENEKEQLVNLLNGDGFFPLGYI